MASLREQLIAYEKENGLIKVGLVGAGQMGTGLMSQIEKMDGLAVVAVADVLPHRSKAAFVEASVSADDVVETEDVEKAKEVIANGKRVALTSSDVLTKISNLDVIVEATGVPEIGARVCNAAIEMASIL